MRVCHGCDRPLRVNAALVVDPTCFQGTKIAPRLLAPFICETCREDKKLLAKARKAMESIIGKPEPVEGFDG